MRRFSPLAGLLLIALGLVWPGSPAFAQEQGALPAQQHPSLRAASALPAEELPSVDMSRLREEDEDGPRRIEPYRYGTVVETQFTPARHGVWEQLPSGQSVWRMRIRSRNAVSLSVGFTRFDVPQGASVFVYDPQKTTVRGPYTRADRTNGQHWTPLVKGEEIVIALTVPTGRRSAVDVVVGKVVHGYRSLIPSQESQVSAKSGTCNLDVACEEADPWRNQVRSVGRYTFEVGGSSYVCTGSLVNNTAEDKTPYFLTAEHCVSSPDIAQTMVFYWNYQNETCRTQGTLENGQVTDDVASDQTSSGATLRARFGNVHVNGSIPGKPDLSLVEIDDEIPASYQLFFNGWSRQDPPPQRSVTIHHPQGHGKRISFDEDPATVTAYAENNGGNTHLRIGNWELGTTEGGSSGSPLFNDNQRVVGVLSGGIAGCGDDGDADDNNQPDWYGRIAPGFQNGDYQGATLADWLDPTNSGTTAIDGENLVTDSIPPALASDFSIDTVTPDSVTLRWTAPGDDGTQGTASEYLLRYSLEDPIRSQPDFENAFEVPNVPTPDPAGTPQSVTLAVNQDTSYYFALVTRDEVNASEISTIERDVTPVPKLRVTTPPRPNPTQTRTTLRFVVEDPQPVRAALYDALGRRLRILYDDEAPSFQRQTISTDLSALSSGIYFVRIRGKNTARTEQVAVVK